MKKFFRKSKNSARVAVLAFSIFLFSAYFQVALASTFVSGEILTDTVWTKAQSPYVVEDYLKIGEGVTLTIDSGAVVKFNQSYIDVYGKIIASGTAEEKIYFTSFLDDSVGGDTNGDGAETVPIQGDWGGIYFADTSSVLLLRNAEMKYSNSIYFDSTNINLSEVNFEDNDSIYLDSAIGDFNYVNFKNNRVIYFDSASVNVDKSNFENNQAFYIDSSDVEISDSIIKNNKNGIIVDSSSFDLKDSIVSGSYGWGSAGIISWGAVKMSIVGNDISGNGGDGIYLESASTTISGNFIYGNSGSGIYVEGEAPATIVGNDIFGNGDFGIYNSLGASASVDARNNWWGDASGPYHPTLNEEGVGDFVSDGVIFEPWLKASIEEPAGFSSVAFIPGIQASRLYRDGWLFENQLWEPNRNDDVRKLFMNATGKSIDAGIYTRDIINETNVPISADGFGLNIYKRFSESMDELVASSTISAWKALPYDWRFDLSDIVGGGMEGADGNISYIDQKPEGQLPYMILELEKLAENSKNGKVTIITHSNGGLVAKALLKKLAEMKVAGESDLIDKIDRLIMVAAPQLGTPQAVTSMLHGDGQELGWGFILKESVAREFAENMLGAYNLLPSEKYFNTVVDPMIKFDSSIDKLNNWRLSYGDEINSYGELQDFLLGKEGRAKPSSSDTDTPNVLNASLRSVAENNHRALDDWQIPSSIEVMQIAGWGLDTVSGVEYSAELECIPVTGVVTCALDYVLKREPIFTSEGDNTVVTPSATAIDTKTYYLDIEKYNKVLKDDSEHAYIFEIQPLEDLLKNIITENSTTTLPAYITTEKPERTDKKLRLSVHSPVSIDIYDNLGNHTGLIPNLDPNSDLDLVEENIPNSYYMNFGEGKYVGFGSGSQNRVELNGTGSGTFTLKVGEYLGDEEATSTAFVDIPVTSAMTGELNIQNLDTLPQLKIDVEGDGTFDFEIKPSEEFDPILFLEIMKKTIMSFDLKKSVEKNLVNRIDNLIKSIKKGKIKQAEKKIKGFIKKFESKKKHNKKISDEEKQAILDMLNQLLNNIK